jgi:hypothetical protein
VQRHAVHRPAAAAIGGAGTQEQKLRTTLVTFGAPSAYILLHVAVIGHFDVRGLCRQVIVHRVSPVIGTAVLSCPLWNPGANARILGLSWLLVGVLIATWFRFSGRLDADRSAHPSASGLRRAVEP